MGKKRNWMILCCILGLVWLSGCTSSSQEEKKVPEMKVGILVYRKEDTFLGTIVEAFEAAAKYAEQQENIKISVSVMDGRGSQAVQTGQIEKCIDQKYDVICVNLVDRTVAASIIDQAKAAQIPLIFFNREPVKEDLERWDKVYYVGAVAKESGILQGHLIADAYLNNPERFDKNNDQKLQYVMLEGEQGHQDALLRTEYSIRTLVSEGIQMDKLVNDTANWHRSQAATKMSQWLEKYGNAIEVVICNNDDMALGAIDAYKAAKKLEELPFIVGIDGTPPAMEALAEGTLYGTIKNDEQKQAQAMFQLCYSLVFHGKAESDYTLEKGKYIFINYLPVEREIDKVSTGNKEQ